METPSLPKKPHGFREFREWPTYHKLGTILSLVSLGMSAQAIKSNNDAMKFVNHQSTVEDKSLQALTKIHEALTSQPPVTL